jgi:L-lactate dehydrogenase (cytochrome)
VTPKKQTLNLNSIINLSDFETAASQLLLPKSFAFKYRSYPLLILDSQLTFPVFKASADDETTTQWNQLSWQSVRLRPRVLHPIKHISLSTTILGTPFSAPFFIAPAGAGKLAHPTGEILMTAAAAQQGVLQWVCNMAGCSMQEMAKARGEDQTLFWQIYAMNDLRVTEREVRRAVELGYRGFALTVDAVRMGNRERDLRLNIEEEEEDADDGKTNGGISSIRP